MTRRPISQTADALSRIKRGLSAYISYLAACDMNKAFSEYVLYEPILRILIAQQYSVECEYECPGIVHSSVGDKKRLDFYAQKGSSEFALEVKWAKSKTINLKRDADKLHAFLRHKPDSRAMLCIFGRKSVIDSLNMKGVGQYRERGKGMYADFRKTKYGCRVFQLLPEE